MQTPSPLPANTVRNVAFILLGVTALVSKGPLWGPLSPVLASYGGNVAASFSVYFLALIAVAGLARGRIVAAVLALAAVELFEVTNGFGFMSNVYDRLDLLANVVGVAAAVAADVWSQRLLDRRTRGRIDGRGD